VDVERQPRDTLQRLHHRRADRDVGYEMAIHHVHVNQVGAAALRSRHRVAQSSEVGRQQ
jgi:hypothetical protein